MPFFTISGDTEEPIMHDQLSGLAAFVQAVKAGSFAEAAQRMQLTRSAVGKSIARLEHRVGARLFHRTTRQLNLTEDGQAYYERCVRALAELDAATAALHTGKSEPRGRLRVTAPPLFGRHCVAPVLLELAHEYPELSIEMSFSDRVMDLVDEDFHLAVRVGTLPDSASLAARRLGAQRTAICAAPSYLARWGQPTDLDELQSHRAIAYARAGQVAPWRVRDGGQTREVRVNSRICFDDLQVIADAAVAGAGLAWLPYWLIGPHVRAGELTVVMDSERVAAPDIHAVWPRERYLPAKIRVAVDALVARIPAMLAHPAIAPAIATNESQDDALAGARASRVRAGPHFSSSSGLA
jgi:DNA-binding transcriptional LysR family regulator